MSPRVASVSRLMPVAVAATLGLASCATVNNHPATANQLFERVTGTWGSMIDGKLSCDRAAETIAFSADRSTATFQSTTRYVVAEGNRTNTITYKVLEVRDNAITMAMNEEHRKTERGDLVVWTLILRYDDEFVWHRPDWPAGATTAPRLRCNGERAAETAKPVPYSRAFAPAPSYPPAARMQRIEGKVTAWLYVEADTTVSKVVVKRSPHELLTQEAIATLSKWRIHPPTKDGKPVPFVAEYDLAFDLSDPNPSSGSR